MIIQFSQLPFPFATLLFVGAVDFEFVKRSLQSFVFKFVEILGVTARTWFVILLDSFYTHSAECISTASDLKWLS
jgi:hypothetical protein